MKNLREKLNKENGFTLVEMLIVVAIIAILIAISIPFVNKSLERAREATDAANERAAIGAAMVEVLGENTLGGADVPDTGTISAYYKVDNSKGTLVDTKPTDKTFKYGKGTSYVVDSNAQNAGKGIVVTYTIATSDFTTAWE